MKRLATALAGSFWGMFLTWLCLSTLSHIHRVAVRVLHTRPPSGGCFDKENCHLSDYATLFAVLLLPAVYFFAVNYLGYRRWNFHKWSVAIGLGTLATVVFYALPYAFKFW